MLAVRTPILLFITFSLLPNLSAGAELKTVTVNGMTVSEETAKAMQGGCEYNPYEKLQQLGIIGNAQVAPKWIGGKPEAGIDPALACRLSKMFAAVGQCAKITSAYRSEAKQRELCGDGQKYGCAAPGSSCHQYGLAVDISGPCLQKLRQIAPQFQLIQNNIPGDPYHFQCAEHPRGSRRSCTGPCNGGIAINPDPNAIANAGNYSPTSKLANMFRQALGLEEQPPQQQQPQIPQQQLPQSQQPTQYFPQQPQTGGGGSGTGSSGGSSQTPGSVSSGGSGAGTGAQQYYGGDVTPQPKSVADQLLELAYGSSSDEQQPQNTATTVPLVLNPNETGELIPTTPASQTQINQQVQPSTSIGSLQPSQTFTSSDLAFSHTAAQPEIKPQPTGMFAVLETMKQTLLRMLEILRPMGIRAALQGEQHDYADEYAE